jgi:hypothetical protein
MFEILSSAYFFMGILCIRSLSFVLCSSGIQGNRALASGFSGQGRYFAVCDDRKYLHIYHVTNKEQPDSAQWTLLSSR